MASSSPCDCSANRRLRDYATLHSSEDDSLEIPYPPAQTAGISATGVGFKLRKALEARTKLDEEKLKKLKEKTQKKEERKKNEAEIAEIKRKKEEMDREEKRKRLEEAQRQQKELEEQLLAKKEAKEQRRRALDEYERKRKAMEEEAKKQRRIEKEKEASERRRRLKEDAKSNKFASKNAKHMEEVHEGKKGIKVKDSETAEAAKRFEERREQGRKIKKELPRHGEHEKKFLEKSKELYKGEKGGEESSIACSEGKRDVKVKALEAVETTKRFEEKREPEHKIRRELARHSEHEKKFLEKSKKELYKREKEGKRDIQVKALEAAEALEKKREQEHKFRKELARHGEHEKKFEKSNKELFKQEEGKRDMKALEAAEAAKRFEEKREQEHKIRKELARHGEHEKKFLEKSKKELYRGVKEGNGYIKVKALEAANQLEENREQECSIRKELVRCGKHEKKFPGKSKELHKGEKEGESNISITSGMARKKPVGSTLPKCHAESYSHAGTSTTSVDFKLRRAFESKTKLEQDKRRKLNEKRQKEEEWKKNAAEIGAIKRKKEEMDRKDRAEKRKRLEEAQKQQKEIEEKLRAKKEAKEQRRQAQDEYERRRKAMEEGSDEAEGSDEEEDDDDVALMKLTAPWARKENLIPHIISQQYVDPDEIFTGARTCNLNEVFDSNDSNRTTDFKRRSSSGEWLNDCFTWEEEFLYKLQMGYIN